MHFTSLILFCFVGGKWCNFLGEAFTIIGTTTTPTRFAVKKPIVVINRLIPLRASTDNTDDEIERLRSMAAKLRAEAALLEVRYNIFVK